MEERISELFAQYAYSPLLVYSAICGFMLLSAFGMPIPEEVVLISAGFVGYMAMNPEEYPPPYEGAPHVNVYILAAVALIAVIGSDFLIYYIGKNVGAKIFKMKWFSRFVSDEALSRIQVWMRKYGYWAVLLFRFTPGVRFPGHLMCGAMGLSAWRFIGVDSLAAMISVPTQVILVATYGDDILTYFKRFKLFVIGLIVLGLAAFLTRKYLDSRGRRRGIQ